MQIPSILGYSQIAILHREEVKKRRLRGRSMKFGRGGVKMGIVICEDDAFERELIRKKFGMVLEALEIEEQIEGFATGRELMERVRGGERYELYILDILLEDKENGIELAKDICKSHPEAQITFITNTREYAVEAFEVGAIHYLVKPVTEKGIMTVLERWMREKKKPEKYLEIQSGKESRKFPLIQIIYIRGKDRGTEIHMEQHKWDAWVNSPFHIIEHEVEEMPQFVRITRGCIVNMEYVSRIDYTECTLKNGEILSISRREQNHVMNSYNDFLFWKMEQEGEKGEGGSS